MHKLEEKEKIDIDPDAAAYWKRLGSNSPEALYSEEYVNTLKTLIRKALAGNMSSEEALEVLGGD